MKKVVLRFRQVDRDKFNAVKVGTKKIETRAATDKFNSLVAGDVLVLICGSDREEKKIKKASHFASLEELFATYTIKDVLPTANSIEEAKAIYYSFPNYEEKIKQHGIIALELEQ